MARLTEWQMYQNLKGLIETAISDACADYDDCDVPLEYNIAISPNLDEVIVVVDDDSALFSLIAEHRDWFIETATNYDDAVDVAEKFFDLR